MASLPDEAAGAERRFERLIGAVSAYAICMLDEWGNIVSWNTGAERIKGYKAEEVVGRHTSIFYTEDDRATGAPARALQAAARDGKCEEMGWRVHKDGHHFWASTVTNAIRDEEGRLVGYAKVIQDISDRRRLEERFRQVVESAPNAMVMITADGQIEMVNTQAEQVFGYSREELLGRKVEMLVPERFRGHHPGLRAVFFSAPASRPMGAGRDLYGLRKDGSEFPVEIGLNPIETDEGAMVLSSIVDISVRRRLEERFRQVVESAPSAMVMINVDGKIEMANTQAEQVFGYDREELLGQKVEMLVPERFRSHHPGLRTAFFSGPTSRPMGAGRDLYGLRKDGSEFPVEIGLNPIETDEGAMVLSAIVDISQRKRLERRFRQVVESSPNAIVMINCAGLIEMVNAQTERLFGYSQDELIGSAVEILVPPRIRLSHPGLRDGYFASPSTRSMGVGRDLHGVAKDGREVPIEIGLNPIETDEGTFVLASIIDITERKRVEDALRGSEARFRLMVSSVKDYAILMLDPQGNVTSWNEGAKRLKGYTEDEVIGEHFSIFYPPEDVLAGKPGRELGEAAKQGTFEDEGWRMRKDGGRFWANVILTSILDRDGGLTGFSKVTRDMTERRRQEERFRRVVESAPNAMVMITAHGLIEMVNAQAERVFGYAREELLGQRVEMLVPERFRGQHPDLRAAFFNAPASRPMGAGRDLYGLRKDGSEFPVEIGLNPIETDEGSMVLSAVVDISDRKQKEARIHEALKEKDVLLGEIHHRVKNNLQVISSLLDIQSGRIEDESIQELLRESQNRVKSMALIHQTLYQSKDFAEVDFGSFLDALLPTLVSSYGVDAGQVALNVNTAEVSLPIDAAIPCGLIINELISNALKHAFPDGRRGEITASLDSDGANAVVLSVGDDGVGLPDDIDVAETATLGLQLVTLLADQLGADLTIQRAHPTRFVLRFPIQR